MTLKTMLNIHLLDEEKAIRIMSDLQYQMKKSNTNTIIFTNNPDGELVMLNKIRECKCNAPDVVTKNQL